MRSGERGRFRAGRRYDRSVADAPTQAGDNQVEELDGAPSPDAAPERTITALLDRWFEGRWALAEASLCVVAAVAAWIVRFAQDDAFITFRYSRNLARGNGLVFNVGEKVEGYTNFLWTWLMAVPEKFGWSSPVFSQLVGIALMVGTVLVVLRFAARVFDSRAMGYLVAVVMLANMSFLAYATGGLETMLQTFLVVSVGALLLPVGSFTAEQRSWRRALAGLCAGLAVLTRLDSTVLLGTWILVHLFVQWRRERERPVQVRVLLSSLVQIGVPFAAVVVPWLVWKMDFYGNLLPNTFYAKSAGNPVVPVLYGIFYLLCFFASYAAFLFIPRFVRMRKDLFAVPGIRQVLVVLPVWFLYVCVVGGDFMEYRFMVVVIPVLAFVAAYLLNRFRSVRAQVLMVAVLLVFSGVHRVAPTVVPFPVLTFRELSHWPNESKTTWKGMGELLYRELDGGPGKEGQPVLAVEPLGVLPYFADLPTIDMLGLTDPGIAREGEPIGLYYPGHVRLATPQQLVDRDVNLVLGLPLLKQPDPDRQSYRLSELVEMWVAPDLKTLPKGAKVVEIPLVENQVMVAIYLQPNAKVDAAIERNGWRVLPIDRVCKDSDLNPLVNLVGSKTCPA